jgi:hypothetical protein
MDSSQEGRKWLSGTNLLQLKLWGTFDNQWCSHCKGAETVLRRNSQTQTASSYNGNFTAFASTHSKYQATQQATQAASSHLHSQHQQSEFTKLSTWGDQKVIDHSGISTSQEHLSLRSSRLQPQWRTLSIETKATNRVDPKQILLFLQQLRVSNLASFLLTLTNRLLPDRSTPKIMIITDVVIRHRRLQWIMGTNYRQFDHQDLYFVMLMIRCLHDHSTDICLMLSIMQWAWITAAL